MHKHDFVYIGTEVSDVDALTPLYHVWKCDCGAEQWIEIDFDAMEQERVAWMLINT